MINFKRGLGKNNCDYVQKDIYKAFCIANPNLQVDYATYDAITTAFNEFLMKDMIYNAVDVYFPFNLGTLGIRKYDCTPRVNSIGAVVMSQTPVDYKATKELWTRNEEAREKKKLVRHLNEHTDGYRYRFFWDKTTNNLKGKSLYQFVALRKFSRLLSTELKGEFTSIDFFLDKTKINTRHANA